MTLNEQVDKMTDILASFIGHTAVHLPDDVVSKLRELRDAEDDPAVLSIYDMMFENMRLASELGRPSCQDTGLVQCRIDCGSRFPLLEQLEYVLVQAVKRATEKAPLRPNAVETFDEINTGDNLGTGAPSISWNILPAWDGCAISTYLAGGGCSLPGHAAVLMPGEGYEGVVRFVLDRVAEYGQNACPPLLVGVGIANSVDTAAQLSKKALFRRVGSHNDNAKAAEMEKLLEDGINAMGIGPQGLGGKASVLGVNIENAVRHTATLKRLDESEKLFSDTIHMNETAVAAQIEKIHAEETSPLHYNREDSLRSIVKLAYFTYRDHYLQMEEPPAGEGYADIIYIPRHDSSWPALVIELKWKQDADGAISQILKKDYPKAIANLGCPILLVGISYDRNAPAGERRHSCRIIEYSCS